jgi:hypothetical protein
MSKDNGNRRPGHYPAPLTPTYLDESEGRIVPVNKLTLAPGDDNREFTILLRPHTGLERDKDFALLRFVNMMQEEARSKNEGELSIILNHQSEFDDVCVKALGLDDEEGLVNYQKLTIFEAYEAFQYAIEYRKGGMRDKQVQAALKKLKGEPEKSPQAETALPLPESETTA